jgi:hypothetical protein
MRVDKILNLLNKLLANTKKGALSWEEAVATDSFQVAFATGVVQLRSEISFRGEETITLDIINEKGAIVERITDDELKQESDPEAAHKLRELYKEARSKALGAEEAIDAILRNLG